MSQTFQQLLGSKTQKAGNGEAVVILQMRDTLMNALGVAHGGIHYHLCATAIKAAAGEGMLELECSIEYFSPLQLTDTARALGYVDRDGKTLVFAHAELYVGERLTAYMSAILLRSQEQDLFGEVVASPSMLGPRSRPDPSVVFALEENICDPKYTGSEAFLKMMFCYNLGSELVKRLKGSLVISVQLDEKYTDTEGAIDSSFFGIISDSALGLTSYSNGDKTVTIKLTTRLYKKAEPSTVLRCRADVTSEIGRLVYVDGSLWDNEALVGSCSGVFYRIGDESLS